MQQGLPFLGGVSQWPTQSNTVTKDELFSLEDSLPQASFVAALSARYVSVKQGELLMTENSFLDLQIHSLSRVSLVVCSLSTS